ncbi:hypothetical protein BSKO_01494 [Bryopsis sp. KO-2023]|nr:hypothetical protein BSKO_01494 [Bryopsis sp. KO-2023]
MFDAGPSLRASMFLGQTCRGTPLLAHAQHQRNSLQLPCRDISTKCTPHVPVLLEEVKAFFEETHLQVYCDCTLGAAGHATALMEDHGELETIIGIDMDPLALQIANEKLTNCRDTTTVSLVRGNFSDVLTNLDQDSSLGHFANSGIDGMLMDLGVSSMQVDTPDRGFSFVADGPLDMRMDPDAAVSAQEVVNTWSEVDLGRIFRDYGEEKRWRQVARRICAAREERLIDTTGRLVEVIGNTFITSKKRKKTASAKKIHPATRVFQALRIAVNKELISLEKVLPTAIDCLKSGGRLGVISFHSLEDKLVKKAFQRAAGRVPLSEFVYGQEITHRSYDPFKEEMQARTSDAVVKILTSKPVMAGEEEVNSNPRSRSAKLRFVEKL